MTSLLTRYDDKIRGVISCYDRTIVQGTLPGLCYAQGMTSYLYAHKIRIFDYAQWAEPLRDRIRANAEELAKKSGIEIEFIRKTNDCRKEARIKEILKERGDHPGLVHILSAMEACNSYRPWHDKKTGKTFLKPDSGKCLHYYFYFIDPDLGLCFLRVPTWAPFRLTFYFNGHNWLASRLKKKGIGFRLLENAFTDIDDFPQAQKLSDEMEVKKIHQALDRAARLYCPVVVDLETAYHWSLSQVEYATDVVFNKQEDLKEIYSALTRTAIHAVKPDQIATFLGRKLNGHYEDEMGNNSSTRIEGTCIRHRMGPVSLKMYDKFGLILRIETTTYDVYRRYEVVEQNLGASPGERSKLPWVQSLSRGRPERLVSRIRSTRSPPAGSMSRLPRWLRRRGEGERSIGAGSCPVSSWLQPGNIYHPLSILKTNTSNSIELQETSRFLCAPRWTLFEPHVPKWCWRLKFFPDCDSDTMIRP